MYLPGGDMKFRIGAILLVGLILLLASAGLAQAQSLCDLITFSSSSGIPGASVTVSGDAPTGSDITIFWDGGTVIGSATSDVYGFSAIATIPTDAALGSHTLTVQIVNVEEEFSTDCPFVFVVTERAVAATSEQPSAPVRLPETGFILLPAGGLVASGLGLLFFRKRRR